MIRSEGNRISTRELLLPILFGVLGMVVVVISIPGQGNSGLTVLGMSISFIGVAIARMRVSRKQKD